MFQSAPLTKARGDCSSVSCLPDLAAFQSAPLTKARGDEAGVICWIEGFCFNPLPSQKQGETLWGFWRLTLKYWFQSAPLTKARGDF